MIQVRLYKGEIDNCPPYNALSYVWGSPEDSKCIELNIKPVSVRSNLYHALHRFRSTTEPILIWVDALCIIQADDKERSEQVRRMREIYGGADKTWIWMGPEEKNSDRVVEMVSDYVDYEDSRDTRFNTYRDREYWEALYSFLKRPWFFRVCVIQELAVSRNPRLVCGQWECSFRVFVSFLNIYFPLHIDWTNPETLDESLWLQLYVERLTALKSLNRAFPGSTVQIGDHRVPVFQEKDSLWTLFHRLGVYSYASWKVDKIFALIGISRNGRPEAIDYERMPEDVYIQAAVEYLSHVGLHVLRLKEDDSVDSLPSWVPTWVTRGINQQRILREIRGDAYPNTQTEFIELSQDLHVLSVKGLVVDEISRTQDHVLPPSGEYLHERDFVPTLEQWEAFALRKDDLTPDPYQDSAGGRPEAFWRTLIMDLDYLNEKPDSDWGSRRFRGLVHAKDFPEDQMLGGAFATTAIFSILGRQLGILQGGYLSLLPSQARVGDKVCLLEGGDVPFIFRRRDKGYRYVGPAYVHGLMTGEGVDLQRRKAQQTKSLISSEKHNGPCYNTTVGFVSSPRTLMTGLCHWLRSTARGRVKRAIERLLNMSLYSDAGI